MPESQNGSKPMLTDAQYDLLRNFVQYVLPALAVFYSALALIWGFGYAEQIVGTIAALTTLFGVILGLSKRSYNKSDEKYDGELVVTDNDEGLNILGVVGQSSLASFVDKGEANLKIVSPDQVRSQD